MESSPFKNNCSAKYIKNFYIREIFGMNRACNPYREVTEIVCLLSSKARTRFIISSEYFITFSIRISYLINFVNINITISYSTIIKKYYTFYVYSDIIKVNKKNNNSVAVLK